MLPGTLETRRYPLRNVGCTTSEVLIYIVMNRLMLRRLSGSPALIYQTVSHWKRLRMSSRRFWCPCEQADGLMCFAQWHVTEAAAAAGEPVQPDDTADGIEEHDTLTFALSAC